MVALENNPISKISIMRNEEDFQLYCKCLYECMEAFV